ncbi:MAG: hypothetical protein AAFO07_20545 [Bacteroidota bacterium]
MQSLIASGTISPNPYLLVPNIFRTFIEHNFYQKVSDAAQLEEFKQDPEFFSDPLRHIALYSDHGVVHVRDVVNQTFRIVNLLNGVLIPLRADIQLRFLRGYSLQIAYLHDIGMANFSNFGRFMHPEYAAQYVFQSDFDGILNLLWKENAGNVPWYLLNVFGGGKTKKLKVIYRELLALSMAHSKSKVPIELLNDPTALRAHVIKVLSTPLDKLYVLQRRKKLEKSEANGSIDKMSLLKAWNELAEFEEGKKEDAEMMDPDHFCKRYKDYEKDAFQWLNFSNKKERKLVVQVLDALRCLRAADALRQRGTVLRTSAGYEIFVDQNSANAVYALRSSCDKELYLLQGNKTINAGEANIASSEFDAEGNLRISFHRGNFRSEPVTRKAIYNVAFAINDIQADSVQSFNRNLMLDKGLFDEAPIQPFEKIQIKLEAVDDHPEFDELVAVELKRLNPDIADRVVTLVSLQGADLQEVDRYLSARPILEVYGDRIDDLMESISKSGLPKEDILNNPLAFNEVKIISLQAGEVLIKEGTHSGFVYIPLEEGLKVNPMGGYESKAAPAYVPIGNTGVIRGSIRNATVSARQKVDCIVIPKQIYLKCWYFPISSQNIEKVLLKK